MGILSKSDPPAPADVGAATSAVPQPQQMRCPNPVEHYLTEVNKGGINMGRWQSNLADKYRSGYRLAHVFEQHGNTVQVFEHHWHD